MKTELARVRSWLLFSAIWFDPTLKHNIFYPSCIIYVKYLLCSFELIVPNDLIQKLKLFEVFLLNSRNRIYSNIFKPQANYKLLSWGPWHLSCYVKSIYWARSVLYKNITYAILVLSVPVPGVPSDVPSRYGPCKRELKCPLQHFSWL